MEQTTADDKLYYRLGQMNLSGTGTPQDLEQAAFYFRKAADLNNTDALYGLGKLYLNKSYADCDPQKAVAHLIEAAKQDHEFAQYTLGKYGYSVSVIDLRNSTRSHGNNLLQLVNKYMDLYKDHPDELVYKAKAEKYAKTIILSGMDAASFGQNAYFYDAAKVFGLPPSCW